MGQTVEDPFEFALREVRRDVIPLRTIIQRLLPLIQEALPDAHVVNALAAMLGEGTVTLERWREHLGATGGTGSYYLLEQAVDACVICMTGWETDHGIRRPQNSDMAVHNLRRLLDQLPRAIDLDPVKGRERVTLALWGSTEPPWRLKK